MQPGLLSGIERQIFLNSALFTRKKTPVFSKKTRYRKNTLAEAQSTQGQLVTLTEEIITLPLAFLCDLSASAR